MRKARRSVDRNHLRELPRNTVLYIEMMMPFAKHYSKTVQGEISKYGKLLQDPAGAKKDGEDELVAKIHVYLYDVVESMIDDGAKARKEKRTIAHILAHKVGLQNAAAYAEYARDAFSILDCEAMSKLMEGFGPVGDPDGDENTQPKAWGYRTISFGWLVGLVGEKIALQYGNVTLPEHPKTPSPFPTVQRICLAGFGACTETRWCLRSNVFGIPVGEVSRLASVGREREAILMKFREMPTMVRFAPPRAGPNAKRAVTQFKGTQSADE
ncbi:hypothetical protein BJ742DRAFT_886172 [Cladochytrium replicatum]|nr:hypothetical protein BJ742DRAFT_886172 [Cladochytrium replicatum]